MNNTDKTIITCKNCGHILNADSSSEEKTPCPKCGSTSRNIFIHITEKLVISDNLKGSITGIANNSLLLQSVIVPEEKVAEGMIISAVSLPWFDIINCIEKDPEIIFKLSAEKWEEMIAGAYAQAGFDKVILTPRSGDLGRDVIAIKKGLGEVRIIDQVKAYKPGHLVTANDVRALMGVLQNDGASKGFLTTTSDFAPRITNDPLITPFIPQRLELINGENLILRLQELAKK
ncbi:MAG: restriction endonuclease [Candidatus Marinimicrobia bacterium]|nr:restriction endonuclease [Candidatus Neomarinimicrobiota bacterium]